MKSLDGESAGKINGANYRGPAAWVRVLLGETPLACTSIDSNRSLPGFANHAVSGSVSEIRLQFGQTCPLPHIAVTP
jgi:hypothetical protein